MSKLLASFPSLSLLLLLRRPGGVPTYLKRFWRACFPCCRERQSVVPWGTQVQLMFGFTAPVTNRPLLPGHLLPEDSRSWLRAQLNHFHHMVVASRAMENWRENRLGGSSFSWLRGGPPRAMEHLGE